MHASAAAFGIALEPRDARAAVPEERESRRRRAVRRDGSDDVRLWRARTRCWRFSASPPNCSRRFRFRTTSSSGGSIRASVMPWADPTTAPSARARSWACESLARTRRCAGRLSGQHRTRRNSSGSLLAICPRRSSGDEFLARYGGTGDTRDDRRAWPAIPRAGAGGASRLRARARGDAFGSCCARQPGKTGASGSATLMYESHASYGACGLGSPGTDRLVELVRGRRSGGGLVWRANHRRRQRRHGGRDRPAGRVGGHRARRRRVRAATGYRPHVFAGSSPGVAAFGARSITL